MNLEVFLNVSILKPFKFVPSPHVCSRVWACKACNIYTFYMCVIGWMHSCCSMFIHFHTLHYYEMCIPRVWHFMKESSVICEYVRFFLASNVCVCTIMLYNAYYSHLIYFLFNRWNETQKGNNRRTSSRMYAYTMAHNNQITSWKIYLVKKMTHIRSEIIVHAYNFCLLLHTELWHGKICVCADFFFYFMRMVLNDIWLGECFEYTVIITFFFLLVIVVVYFIVRQTAALFQNNNAMATEKSSQK